MAILRLTSITCLAQAETFEDELYVTFNGTKRSLPAMSKGQSKALRDEFLFQGAGELSLFENDGDHWYDRDDFIGTRTIGEAPVESTLEFKATSGNALGAHYTVGVQVGSPTGAALLSLRSITCLVQAETFTDELYVTFNGTKRSLPDMTQGQTLELGDEFRFFGSQQLSLFENDGDHWYDRDDFIGSHVISTAPDDRTLEFRAMRGNAAPAHYALSVSVAAAA